MSGKEIIAEAKADAKASKESNIKTYKKAQIFWALLPWGIVFTLIVAASGLYFGWTIRTSFDATIKAEVITQVQRLK